MQSVQRSPSPTETANLKQLRMMDNRMKWSELRLSLRRLGLDDSEADQLFAMLEANGEMDPEKTNRADTRPTQPLPART